MESRPTSRFLGKRIHFIGIGGCGMSGLARVLLDAGAIISGSDAKPNLATAELAALGAAISDRQDGQLLRPDVDLVVRTAAVPDTNIEYQRTCALGLRHTKYAQMLGHVMAERLGVAVSGTHGKTTTTSMISYALLASGADPSFVIGGTVAQLGGSSRSGLGQSFVVEACEFDRSFHNLSPAVAVITNIEADHLDCYAGGIDEIVESFRLFAQRVPDGGLVIANGQDQRVRRALADLPTACQWVGLDDPQSLNWSSRALGIEAGCYRGEVFHDGVPVAELKLSVPGRHNLFNATAALAACHACGVPVAPAAAAIGRFLGADRRMTELGQCNQAHVVDDYGHHPTEIRTTLRALREKYVPQRLICVFQPHQYSRTRHLLDDFATSFADADLTILPDIYAARDSDTDRASVSTADLMWRIASNGQRALHLPRLAEIVDYLKRESRPGDLIVTMGAGNIDEVGRELIAR